MPALRVVTPQGRSLVVHLRPFPEHCRHRRSVPRLFASVDFNAVPLLYALVAPFRLV
jgi:hypothetical protein